MGFFGDILGGIGDFIGDVVGGIADFVGEAVSFIADNPMLAIGIGFGVAGLAGFGPLSGVLGGVKGSATSFFSSVGTSAASGGISAGGATLAGASSLSVAPSVVGSAAATLGAGTGTVAATTAAAGGGGLLTAAGNYISANPLSAAMLANTASGALTGAAKQDLLDDRQEFTKELRDIDQDNLYGSRDDTDSRRTVYGVDADGSKLAGFDPTEQLNQLNSEVLAGRNGGQQQYQPILPSEPNQNYRQMLVDQGLLSQAEAAGT
jgi:hypothetical protein